jgi:hypothetical protein
MNGPAHYAEAERLLAIAGVTDSTSMAQVQATLAMAQVHATLALAAAIAESESEVLSAAWAGALR